LLVGCSTLAEAGGGEQGIPNARAGPFREIAFDEIGNSRVAPYALRDDDHFDRDVSLLDLDGDPTTFEAEGYVSRTVFADEQEPDPTALPNQIVRFDVLDGRSFDRQVQVVLEPQLDWEGGTVGAPSALRIGGDVHLYYEAAGGIGLAIRSDVAQFERRSEPVLAPDEDSWEQGATPASPSVLRLPDGSYRMFYEVPAAQGTTRIGEARSDDGITWTRTSTPALEPSPSDSDTQFDGADVSGPGAVLSRSLEDREILWLYYGATDPQGKRTIAVAARYGSDGPLQRAVSPVFGTSGEFDPGEPMLMRYDDFTLLFVTQRAGSTTALDYPAVAIGVAPATATLPTPVD